ncbi:hypothetical protein HNV11_11945 [Spirosoma taeanense]|uniref:Type 1 periplasmic binding fold superfamily protein n=1 Tax=Spirosoma taeanense TaxID=2735870 RepID=A0A6M5Y967_9BACT|nr:hypothetical protein [Spirosoma taeanense]QJW90034.1 hypothetical protein HNV11_11945 [Spirosoma taeanense]
MSFFQKTLIWILPVTLMAGACKHDEQNVAPTDDNEAITTASLSFTNTAAPREIVTATIENLNTQADLSQATINLKANTTYTGGIVLLDKTKTPVLVVTDEIREKANEHLLVYTFTPATGSPASLTVTATDLDTNPTPLPVGLTTRAQTGMAGSGKLNVVLRHQPNVKNGLPAPGSDDLNINFPVVIR